MDVTKNKKDMYNFYRQYTSTQALVKPEDAEPLLKWSSSYLESNISHLLPLQKDAIILDVACGYGRHLASLRDMGYSNCIGVDLSREQIQYAKNKLNLINVIESDIFLWLNQNDQKFDCILVIDFLEHLNNEDLINLTIQLRNILTINGRIIIQVPNGINPINPTLYSDLTHVRAFTSESLRQLFLLAGFSLPFSFHEALPPKKYNFANTIKRLIWKTIIRPFIHFMVTLTYHKMENKVYTTNIIAVAYNN